MTPSGLQADVGPEFLGRARDPVLVQVAGEAIGPIRTSQPSLDALNSSGLAYQDLTSLVRRAWSGRFRAAVREALRPGAILRGEDEAKPGAVVQVGVKYHHSRLGAPVSARMPSSTVGCGVSRD